MAIIRELNEEGITAILITHFMSEAAQADRIVVLRAGRVLADRTPQDLFADNELIMEAGLERPPLIELRNKAGLPESIMSIEDMILYLRKQN